MVTTLWMVYSPPNCALQQGASNDVRIRSQLKKKKKRAEAAEKTDGLSWGPPGLAGEAGGFRTAPEERDREGGTFVRRSH